MRKYMVGDKEKIYLSKVKCRNSYLLTVCSEDFCIDDTHKGMDMRYISFQKKENITLSANEGEQL